jgi:transcription elongation factor Elf1
MMEELEELLIGEKVEPVFACPRCGERSMDLLAFDETGDLVICGMCGKVYDPLTEGGKQ